MKDVLGFEVASEEVIRIEVFEENVDDFTIALVY